MSKFSEKGYFVKENPPVYLTLDKDMKGIKMKEKIFPTMKSLDK